MCHVTTARKEFVEILHSSIEEGMPRYLPGQVSYVDQSNPVSHLKLQGAKSCRHVC
jgi:hypothetical protein